MEEKRRFFQMCEYQARIKGYADGWKSHKFKSKFGIFPRGMDGLGPIEPDAKFLNYLKYQNIRWAKSKSNPNNQVAA
jgi:DNA repair protein RadD